MDALQQLLLQTLDKVFFVFAPYSFFEFLDRRNLQLLHLALQHGLELKLHLLHDLKPQEFLELPVLEGVEILKVIDILSRVEAILGRLEVFVLLLELLVDAVALELVPGHLELYPEPLTLHFLILLFSVLRVLLLALSFSMVYIDVALFQLRLVLCYE